MNTRKIQFLALFPSLLLVPALHATPAVRAPINSRAVPIARAVPVVRTVTAPAAAARTVTAARPVAGTRTAQLMRQFTPREQTQLARVTVYWASGGRGSDRYTRQHKCSTGARLRVGHCAVDPRRVPYGSKVIFPDTTLLAVDTGTDVINRKAARKGGRTALERNAIVIDRFFETKRQALAWANSHPHFMTLRIVPPAPRVQSAPIRVASAPVTARRKFVAAKS